MADTDLDPQTGIDLEGPDEDDAEAMYDPTEIEASRARELGLGLGARELERQRDPHGDGRASYDGGAERLNSDEITAADSIADNDANDLSIDEEFDTEDDGPNAERLDDRSTGARL